MAGVDGIGWMKAWAGFWGVIAFSFLWGVGFIEKISEDIEKFVCNYEIVKPLTKSHMIPLN